MDGIHEGETDGARLARMGTDATTWAREMAAAAREVAARERDVDALTLDEALSLMWDEAPGDFLHVWLCAAIEAGRAAGYSQGRRDAQAAAREAVERVNNSHGYNTPGDAARAAADVVERSIGWPLVDVDEPGLPANLAGRTQPEDPAGRDLPADLAGRDEASPIARAADALEQIAETLRSVVRPLNGGVSYPAVRVVRS